MRERNLQELSGGMFYIPILRSSQKPDDGSEKFYVDDGTNFEEGTLWWGSKVLFCGESGVGDPGFEQGGVMVAGAIFDAIWKVNDFGGGRDAICIFHRHSTTDPCNVLYSRTNSDDATHAIVTNGMIIANQFFAGWDGASYQLLGGARMVVDGAPGAGDMPGRYEILTTPNGTIVPVLRFRITNDGIVNLQNGVRPGDGTLGNGGRLHSGAGVPAAGLGDNGDFFFRSDGGAGNRIYFKTGGAWGAIV